MLDTKMLDTKMLDARLPALGDHTCVRMGSGHVVYSEERDSNLHAVLVFV